MLISRSYKGLAWIMFPLVLNLTALQQASAQIPPLDCDLPEYAPGEIRVILKWGHSLDELRNLNEQVGVVETKRISLSRRLEERMGGKLYKLSVPLAADIPRLVERYSALPPIVYAAPNYLYYGDYIPNDPLFQSWQRNLRQGSDKDIDADQAPGM